MKKFKVILGAAVIVAACLVVFSFYNKEEANVPAKPIILSADIETEKPFKLQIYWTEDDFDNFHGQQSVFRDVEIGPSHIEQEIQADMIHKIRLDFGSNPGKVSIKNIQLNGVSSVSLDVNRFGYFSSDIQNHEVVDDALIIESDQSDPYAIYGPILDLSAI